MWQPTLVEYKSQNPLHRFLLFVVFLKEFLKPTSHCLQHIEDPFFSKILTPETPPIFQQKDF